MAFLFRDAAGIPRATASTEDSVLIIIDAQNEYADGMLKVSDVAASRAVIASLLERYRSAGQGKKNVVHVVHRVPAGTPVFTPGTPLEEEFEELRPREGEKIIEKTLPGSFAKTDLHEYLQSIGAKKVVLVGYMAHVCVSTTARQAHELGYEVIIAEDGVGDRALPGLDGAEVTKYALLELADFFATVVRSKEIR
ncbi:Isochorismatase-like protein [Thermoascus aurantiacus ATCC 26904]